MKLHLLFWVILITLNVLMWQWFLSTRVQFEILPAYDPDKDIILLPFPENNERFRTL
jgi:hypothetical protein